MPKNLLSMLAVASLAMAGCSGVALPGAEAPTPDAGVTPPDAGVTSPDAGTVVPPEDPSDSNKVLAASPSGIDFGAVQMGSREMRTLRLLNAGTGPLTVTHASASGADFSAATPPLPQSLEAGQELSIDVHFEPTVVGDASGTLTVSSDALGSPLTVPLTGTGAPMLPPGVVPAFPGAQGGGARTGGGRGGKVIKVTNLNDSGPGSLRSCVQTRGPRTCIFTVGGTLRLASTLRIEEPFITIAGQTAPGGGIALDGRALSGEVLSLRTNDVILRYLRVRKGFNSGSAGGNQSGQTIAWRAGARNIVVDHVSVTWCQDENITIWANTSDPARAPRDTTLSWSLVAEPLSDHPVNIITGSDYKAEVNAQTDIDFHHNFIANSSHRNPLFKHKRGRFVNNLVYNWSYYAAQIGGGGSFDVLGNVFSAGPLTPDDVHEIQVYPRGNSSTADGTTSLHVAENVGLHDPNASDNWNNLVREINGENGDERGTLGASYRRDSPLSAPGSGVALTVEPTAMLAEKILADVGASKRLACDGTWESNRDAVDVRIIEGYPNKGGVPNRETDAGFGGFPTLAAGTPCPDTDDDGIPDAFELARCGLASCVDANEVGADGYTQLERYLNGM